MTRKSIFELLAENYNAEDEIKEITDLFHSCILENFDYNPTLHTIEFAVQKLFHRWKARRSCVSCENMRYKLGLKKSLYGSETIEVDAVITYLEYYCNIIRLFQIKNSNPNYCGTSNFEMLIQNIASLIEHLNHEAKIFKDEEFVLLVPKDAAATAVAELSTPKTALAIVKYHHASLKGNLEGKRSLLYDIALEYETLLKNPVDKYKDFFVKTNGLLNNLNIRHNNKTVENNKNTVINLSDEELEHWYDELYQMLLFCVLTKDNSERLVEADNLLKTFKRE